jgi:mRNA interferase MazF
MKKTRPCLILSDDELNFHYLTVIVAPLTKTQTNFPTRIKSSFMETAGEIALDHLRAVDKTRLVKKL